MPYTLTVEVCQTAYPFGNPYTSWKCLLCLRHFLHLRAPHLTSEQQDLMPSSNAQKNPKPRVKEVLHIENYTNNGARDVFVGPGAFWHHRIFQDTSPLPNLKLRVH